MGGFAGFEDIFGGASAGPQERQYPDDGADITTRLSITFMEAIKGVTSSLSYMAWVRCGKCRGSGLKQGARPRTCNVCGGSGE